MIGEQRVVTNVTSDLHTKYSTDVHSLLTTAKVALDICDYIPLLLLTCSLNKLHLLTHDILNFMFQTKVSVAYIL